MQSQPTMKLRLWYRLTRVETGRLLARPRFVVTLCAILIFAAYQILVVRPRGTPPGLFGVLSTTSDFVIQFPLIVGFCVSDTLAADTEIGYVGLILSRNCPRSIFLASKVMAMMLVASLCIAIRHFFFIIFGAISLPWHSAIIKQTLVDPLRFIPGPVPYLFISHPIYNDVMVAIMTLFASSIISLAGLIPSVLGASPYIATAAPVAFYLGGSFLFRGPLSFLNPDKYLNIWWNFRILNNSVVPLLEWSIYWIAVGAILTLPTLLLSKIRELGAR